VPKVGRNNIPPTDAIFHHRHQVNHDADAASEVLCMSVKAKATGKVDPCSRYPTLDAVFLSGVCSNVTRDGMADGITQWWTTVRACCGPFSTMVINLDHGLQHHRRRTQCMPRMGAVVRHSHLHVRCAYLPPYHSKDHPIERCWGLVENHWQGTLLGAIETVLVSAETMPWKDMESVVKLVLTTYKTGV
jgi:hypothetical protein